MNLLNVINVVFMLITRVLLVSIFIIYAGTQSSELPDGEQYLLLLKHGLLQLIKLFTNAMAAAVNFVDHPLNNYNIKVTRKNIYKSHKKVTSKGKEVLGFHIQRNT